MASFAIAVDRCIVQGREKVTDFFNVVAWNATAEFVNKHFVKGQPICVNGRLQQNSWPDPETKTTRYSIEVVAESVHFAGFMRNDARNNTASQAADFDPYAGQAAA